MDLNALLYAHQLATMQAEALPNAEERQCQFDLIALYARRIRLLREQSGAPDSRNAFVVGEPGLAHPA